MTGENIDRQVHFAFAPAFDPQDTTGVNNTWVYNRAPEGYLFLLAKVQISASAEDGLNGTIGIFDGHEYTHWNIFPGVESREYLSRFEINSYQAVQETDLLLWECKEYTIGMRSRDEGKGFKLCAIVWYYLKKASRIELMEYAIKHPLHQDTFKRVLRGTTLSEGEGN